MRFYYYLTLAAELGIANAYPSLNAYPKVTPFSLQFHLFGGLFASKHWIQILRQNQKQIQIQIHVQQL